jgi:hypothetical protein
MELPTYWYFLIPTPLDFTGWMAHINYKHSKIFIYVSLFVWLVVGADVGGNRARRVDADTTAL